MAHVSLAGLITVYICRKFNGIETTDKSLFLNYLPYIPIWNRLDKSLIYCLFTKLVQHTLFKFKISYCTSMQEYDWNKSKMLIEFLSLYMVTSAGEIFGAVDQD